MTSHVRVAARKSWCRQGAQSSPVAGGPLPLSAAIAVGESEAGPAARVD